jgi:type III restriction enzyme
VNNYGNYGRWAFAEFTEVYTMQYELEAEMEKQLDKIIDEQLRGDHQFSV